MTLNTSPASDRKRPFWKEPMMWVVLGIPLASIVAGVGLVVVSVRSGSADAVMDKVDRVSQIQTTDLAPDQAALKLGLSAVLRVEDGIVEVLPATGDFDRGKPLVLLLQHPIEAAKDVTLTLSPTAAGWRAEAKVAVDHAWRVRLGDADETWRIRGRLPSGQRGTLLQPALDDPDAPAPESAPAQ